MGYRIKNWMEYQHYKDRDPKWIKLYTRLLNDYEWHILDGLTAKYLVMLWMLASEYNGNLPSMYSISFRLRITEKQAERLMVELSHWIEVGSYETHEKWGTATYVSPALRAEVLKRDADKCVFCGATERLEIDHIFPRSKGGLSLKENLQVLCRSCNRTKRTRVANATQTCSLEKEVEEEKEVEVEEKREETLATEPPPSIASKSLLEIWENNRGAMSSVRSFTNQRVNKCKQRLRSPSFNPEDFRVAVCKASTTPFLLGDNERGWKADFDWFIASDTNYVKVLEGKYDGKPRKADGDGATKHEQRQRKLHEERQRALSGDCGLDEQDLRALTAGIQPH